MDTDTALAIAMRDDFACSYCGTDLRGVKPEDFTFDLISEYGYESSTPITACMLCSTSRPVGMHWREFAVGGAILRIEQHLATPLNYDLARALLAGEIKEEG